MDTTKISFQGIKEEIVDYLKGQETFKDYNFTAPGMSVLVDALAYTTHYLVRYANFSINECFLDSAQLRHNVVAQAKQIGYMPYQWKTAKARIVMKYVPTDAAKWRANLKDLKIPEGTTFVGQNIDGDSFLFRTTEQHGFTLDEKGNWCSEMEIVEGTFVEDKFTQDEMYMSRYYLTNEQVDLEYISVHVHESDADVEGQQWKPAASLTDFGRKSPLYYLQEAYNEKIEVYFGDNKISRMPDPYNIIKVRYLATNGPEANDIADFKLSSTIDSKYGIGDFEIICLNPSAGGATRESIESIQFNAPMHWQAQDRAVTIQDYNALLLGQFGGWLKSVVSWGGETAVPPRYGEVEICCLGRYSEILSPVQKSQILEYLESKNLPDIDVVLIDPDPVAVDVRIVVDWWKWKTTQSGSDIRNKLDEATRKFFEQYLSSFNVKLKYSSLLMTLTKVSDAIDNLVVHLSLIKYITPDWKHTSTYKISFLNPIEPGSVVVGPWTIAGTQLSCWDVPKVDSGGKTEQTGVLYLGKSSKSTSSREPIGIVDYDSGEVTINSYKFDDGVVNSIPVAVSPSVLNIATARNGIFKLNSVSIDAEERV